MLHGLRTLLGLLARDEHRKAWFVFLLTVTMAFAETLGVASIMPFVAVLSKPDLIRTNEHLARLNEAVGSLAERDFLLLLGTATFLLLVGSTALRLLTLWAQLRFIHSLSSTLAVRLVAGYLYQPYEWFLGRHSADMASKILSDVNYVVHGAHFTALVLAANSFVAILLVALLLAVDPKLAIGMAGAIGIAYVSVFYGARRYLSKAGEERVAANKSRYRVLGEAFGGIKQIKIRDLESRFVERFREPSVRLARHSVVTMIVSEFPSFFVQALLFGGMVLVLLYLVGARGSVAEALPFAALYALAGYRLMPALQGMYRGITQLRVMMPSADALHRDLREVEASARAAPVDAAQSRGSRKGLRTALELRTISYRYPNADAFALDKASVTIPAFTTVGIVGSTGSGKTTLVDVILGLLRPQHGEVLIDGEPLTNANLNGWRLNIGYVPQTIFLADDTVAANIAFAVPENEIDQAAVERAARVANLHDFVMTELPAGYATAVGEDGVRLSGGQRQRIGIARALYHDPDVLVFDEATSALDNLTEHAVMEAIRSLARAKTIVLIAHRLTTVQQCDAIYVLERGRVHDVGTFDELIDRNDRFRAMAMVGS